MGNVSSIFVRTEDATTTIIHQNGRRREMMTGEEFLSEAVSGIDMNQQDYQITLHQYLTQRYASRYNNHQRTHNASPNTNNQSQIQQNASLKDDKSKNASFNNASEDQIILNLKGKKLKDFPSDIFYHDDMTSLDVSNNDISILPKDIKKLFRLNRLALGGNQIIALPEEISSLKELTWLDFTNNRISDLPANFAKLKKLTSLGASDCRLNEFPKVICQLKNIRKLGIFNNLFDNLPKEIGNLKLLTKLDLSGNALLSLPDEIGYLTELSWLNLSHNRLECVPNSLSKLTKLTELGLAHNKIKRLPDLSTLTELTLLPVYNNELVELGDWIGNLLELNKLDLSCNELRSIPASILLPPKLNFLNLRKNFLKDFPNKIFDKRIDAMVQLPLPLELVTVDVRENQFESLPLGLIGPSLVELKTLMNPWRSKDQVLNPKPSEIKNFQIKIPSLLDLACAQLIQTDALHPLLSSTTLPLQIHILQKTHRCQYCEKPDTYEGIDCMLWRATTDSTEVPFMANVCCRSCLKALDATFI